MVSSIFNLGYAVRKSASAGATCNVPKATEALTRRVPRGSSLMLPTTYSS